MLDIIQADNLLKLTFLHPHGLSSSFRYPKTHDIRTVPKDNILTVVDPRTGHVYTLSRNKITSISEKFRIASE